MGPTTQTDPTATQTAPAPMELKPEAQTNETDAAAMPPRSKILAAVGRVVLVFNPGVWEGPRPAFVTSVSADEQGALVGASVHLDWQLDGEAMLANQRTVLVHGPLPLYDALRDEQRAQLRGPWAEWMPYQVGQAQRTQQAEGQLRGQLDRLSRIVCGGPDPEDPDQQIVGLTEQIRVLEAKLTELTAFVGSRGDQHLLPLLDRHGNDIDALKHVADKLGECVSDLIDGQADNARTRLSDLRVWVGRHKQLMAGDAMQAVRAVGPAEEPAASGPAPARAISVNALAADIHEKWRASANRSYSPFNKPWNELTYTGRRQISRQVAEVLAAIRHLLAPDVTITDEYCSEDGPCPLGGPTG